MIMLSNLAAGEVKVLSRHGVPLQVPSCVVAPVRLVRLSPVVVVIGLEVVVVESTE
jgi:hypothetical protein